MSDVYDELFGDEADEAPADKSPEWPEIAPSAAIADLLGISVRRLTELRAEGVISDAGRGRWPVRETVRAYAGHLRNLATGRAVGTSAGNLTAERIREAAARANKLEIQVATARGEMVPARDVERQWSSTLRDVRAGMLAVPSRCGAVLPHLTAFDVAAIDAEIRAALEGLADGR